MRQPKKRPRINDRQNSPSSPPLDQWLGNSPQLTTSSLLLSDHVSSSAPTPRLSTPFTAPPTLDPSDSEAVDSDDNEPQGNLYQASEALQHRWSTRFGKLPGGKKAARYRHFLNKLGGQRRQGRIQEFIYILCKERKHAKRRLQFQDMKRFILEIFLPDEDLVSNEEILGFLQKRGLKVLTDQTSSEMRQISFHREVREVVNDTNALEQMPVIPVQLIKEKAPLLLTLIRLLRVNHEHKKAKPRYEEQRDMFLVCYLLSLRYPRLCSAFTTAVGLLLHSTGTSRKGLDIMHRMGVCVEYKSILHAHHTYMEERRRQVRLMGQNPAVNITYDNFDLDRSVNDERFGDHKDHLSSTTAMINEGIEMPSTGLYQTQFRRKQLLQSSEILQAGVLQTAVIKSFWRSTILHAISTVFTDEFKPKADELSRLAVRPKIDIIQPVIAAKQTYKQRHQPIAPLMINESTVANTVTILENIVQTQLQMEPSSHFFKTNLILVHGDQKTVGLLRQAQRHRYADDTAYDRLDWVHPVMGLWHFKYNYLELLHELYWQKASPSGATLHASAAFLNRKRLDNPHGDFRALEQLVLHSFQARIVAMFIDAVQQTRHGRIKDKHEVQSIIRDWVRDTLAPHIIDTIDTLITNITCAADSTDQTSLDVEYEDHRIFLQNTFPYLMTKFAIKYGDVGLLRVALAQACVLYQGTTHIRYAKELLYTFRSIGGSTATSEFQRAILANTLVNDRGLVDTFFEKDRKLELWNKVATIWHKHHSSSSIPIFDLLTKAMLLAPQTTILGRKFMEMYKVQSNTFHGKKSAQEDIQALAFHLWAERSVRKMQRRTQSQSELFQHSLQQGLHQLDAKVTAANEIIDSGDGTVYDAELEDALNPLSFSAEVRPHVHTSEFEFEFLSDTESLVYTSQANSDCDSPKSIPSSQYSLV